MSDKLPADDLELLIHLFGDRVLVRRFEADSLNIAADPVFARSDGSRHDAMAQAETISSRLVISSPGVRKDRAFVVAVGPKCKRVSVGDMATLPPPNDIMGRFPIANFTRSGAEYIWYHEHDLLFRTQLIPVPLQLQTAFGQPQLLVLPAHA